MMTDPTKTDPPLESSAVAAGAPAQAGQDTGTGAADADPPREVGGPKGPEPTRYNDWERNGRCSDF